MSEKKSYKLNLLRKPCRTKLNSKLETKKYEGTQVSFPLQNRCDVAVYNNVGIPIEGHITRQAMANTSINTMPATQPNLKKLS